MTAGGGIGALRANSQDGRYRTGSTLRTRVILGRCLHPLIPGAGWTSSRYAERINDLRIRELILLPSLPVRALHHLDCPSRIRTTCVALIVCCRRSLTQSVSLKLPLTLSNRTPSLPNAPHQPHRQISIAKEIPVLDQMAHLRPLLSSPPPKFLLIRTPLHIPMSAPSAPDHMLGLNIRRIVRLPPGAPQITLLLS
jgi:hypothetical protein